MADYRRIDASSSSASAHAQWGKGSAIATGDGLFVPYGCSLTTDLAVMAAVDLTAFVVESGVVCNLGTTTGTPLELLVSSGSTARFLYLGAGTYAYLTGDFDQFEWSPSAPTQLTLTGGNLAGGLVVSFGSVTVSALCDFGASAWLLVTGGSVTVLAKAGDVVPSVRVNGGTCLLMRDFTAAYVGGSGRLTFDGAGLTGGTVEIDGDAAAAFIWLDGDIGAVEGRSGEFDYSRLRTPATCASIRDTSGLVERQAVGATLPTFTARTSVGRGSRKVRG